MSQFVLCFLWAVFVITDTQLDAATPNISAAVDYLSEVNNKLSNLNYRSATANWNYATNITPENTKISNEVSLNVSLEIKALAKAWNISRDGDWNEFKAVNNSIYRQFKKLMDVGPSALQNKTKLERLQLLQSEMETIYSTAEAAFPGPDNLTSLPLNPGLEKILASSRNYHLQLWAWDSWRNVSGAQIKDKYIEFVKLLNEGYQAAGYKNAAEGWKSAYEYDDSTKFEKDLEGLLDDLKPLYQKLHAYVRTKLKEQYKDIDPRVFPASNHIPAHLLGNMWAQQWNNILPIVLPYPAKKGFDITDTMVKKGVTPIMMFELAEQFFDSLGLGKMPASFWDKSMLVKPDDGRKVVCHASAWDFYKDSDFRIKQCTIVTMDELFTVHHEMGHIQYYIQYKDQPILFRRGANPGFHEAIGDLMALSVQTPKHLKAIGYLEDDFKTDKESTINYLLGVALEKIAFLPFGYLIDKFRWNVFSGKVQPDKYNDEWWRLRCKYQGIYPPTKRDSSFHFDAGAKYHVPSNVPYVRYFVSFVIQFQFHKHLCKLANQTGPLHECDIYKSEKAGAALKEAMMLGSSKHWTDALKIIADTEKMSTKPLLEYFDPLNKWLDEQLKDAGDTKWTDECPTFDSSVSPTPFTNPTKATTSAGNPTSVAAAGLTSFLLSVCLVAVSSTINF